MSATRPRPRGAAFVRQVLLLVLLVNAVFAVALTLHVTAPPAGIPATVFTAGVLLAGVGHGFVFHAAVATGMPPRRRRERVGMATVVTLALWWPCFAWAEQGQAPWGWLAGFLVGAVALASGWIAASGLAVLMVAFAAGGALRFGSPVMEQVLTVLGTAALLVAMMQVVVWMYRLLAAAEAAKESSARLAVAEERLRVSRDLHDVLGHRLGIIALKAELADGLIASDPVRASAECEAIRELAALTVAEARQAVHGDTSAELAEQLTSAELVLSSAGITTRTTHAPDNLPRQTAQVMATVIREAVTNILRHSDASEVDITVTGPPDIPVLVIVNDGVKRSTTTSPHRSSVGSGTGLAALRERCAATGARLDAGHVADDRFEVRVHWPAAATTRAGPS